MKKLFSILTLVVFLTGNVFADVKISQLPLGSASSSNSNDSFPYVDSIANTTKRLDLSDLVNLPSFQSEFLSLIPNQSGQSGKCLGTNGTVTGWTTCGGGGGSGTVTNFSFTNGSGFTGSVTNSTTTPTLSLGTSVTGILKGNGAAMSAAIAADFPTLNQNTTGSAGSLSSTFSSGLPLIGQGTGVPTTGTKSGSTSVFATTTGSLTNGDCVQIDASGNLVDAGAACGTGGGGGVTTIGTIDSQAKAANGAVISTTNLYMQTADGTHPGLMSTATQTIAGQKTFSTGITGTLTGHSSLDLAAANNLSDVASANTSLNNILPSQSTFGGDCLTTNGSTTSWGPCGTTTTPGGSNKYVQYNNSGAFGGSADFQWDDTAKLMSVGTSTTSTSGTLTLGGSGTGIGTINGGGGALNVVAGPINISTNSASQSITFKPATVTSMALDTSGNVNIAGLTASKPVFTDGSKNLSSSGTVGVANGGTGVATLAAHGLVIGNGTGNVVVSGAGTSGQVLTSNGASADPTYQASTVAVQGQASGSSSTSNTVEAPNYQVTNLGSSKYLVETGNDNLLKNPNFQETGITSSVVPDWNIAGSGVVSAIETTTKIGNDPQSLKLTLSSASGDLLYQDVTLTGSVSSISEETSLWVNTTVSGLRICPRLSASTITSGTSCTTIQPNGIWQPWPANVQGGSGSIGVSLNAASSVSGAVYVSRGKVAPSTNYSLLNQSQWVGRVTASSTSGCSPNGPSSTTLGNFTAATGCTFTTLGSVSAPGTQIPAAVLSGAPGVYTFVFNGQLQSGVGTNQSIAAAFSDGTNTSQVTQIPGVGTGTSTSTGTIIGSINETAPFSGLTFQMQTAATSSNVIVNNVHFGSSAVFSIDVFYSPSQSSLAVQAGQQWQPTVTRLLSGTSQTYTVPTGVSRIEVEMVGGGGGGGGAVAGSGDGGAGGGTIFGTWTAGGGGGGSAGPNSITAGTGGTVTSGSGANVLVSLTGARGNTAGSESTSAGSGSGASSFFGGAGGNQAAANTAGGSAVTNSGSGGGGATGAAGNSPGNGGGAGAYVKLDIPFPSSTYTYTIGAAGAAGAAGGSGFAGGAGGSGVIIIHEYYYAANAPQFAGQVSSTGTGQFHHEFWNQYSTCTSGSCTATNQSGGFTSVSNTSHVYTATFNSGVFSAAPSCTFVSGGGTAVPAFNVYPTTTSLQFAFFVAGTATDEGFTLDCMGPR